jgi:hypothetical protein
MGTNVSEEPATSIIIGKKSSILMMDSASSRAKLLSTKAYVVTFK